MEGWVFRYLNEFSLGGLPETVTALSVTSPATHILSHFGLFTAIAGRG
jgi:hypothetical protein